MTWRTAPHCSRNRRVVRPSSRHLSRSLVSTAAIGWCINWMFVRYAYHVASRTWPSPDNLSVSVVVSVECFTWMPSRRRIDDATVNWCHSSQSDVSQKISQNQSIDQSITVVSVVPRYIPSPRLPGIFLRLRHTIAWLQSSEVHLRILWLLYLVTCI